MLPIDLIEALTLMFLGAVLCIMGIVAGLGLAEYKIRFKARQEKEEASPDEEPMIVVDAIAIEVDTWDGKETISLFIDNKWKVVANFDFKKIQAYADAEQEPRFVRSSTPMSVVKKLKAPLVFGGYV